MSAVSHHPYYQHVVLRGHERRVGLPPKEEITTVKSLAKHLQAALQVELCTIPLYLTGFWSVHNKTPEDKLAKDIIHVAAEEMLHLCLAGNVMRSMKDSDGNSQFFPTLYLKEFVPNYPLNLPGRVPPLPLHLQPLTKENLQTFVDLETPETPIDQPTDDSGTIEYTSLGEFYLSIWKGIERLDKEKPLFAPESVPFQFGPEDQLWSRNGTMVQVLNLESAYEALSTIVVQGEGDSKTWPPPHTPIAPEPDHYEIFKGWREGTANWTPINIVSNPATKGYKDSKILQLSRTFDAAYCLLLLNLQVLWTTTDRPTRTDLLTNGFHPIMGGIMRPLGQFMRDQPVGNEFATPAFNFYDFDPSVSASKQLQSELDITCKLYAEGGVVPAPLQAIQTKASTLTDMYVPKPHPA